MEISIKGHPPSRLFYSAKQKKRLHPFLTIDLLNDLNKVLFWKIIPDRKARSRKAESHRYRLFAQ